MQIFYERLVKHLFDMEFLSMHERQCTKVTSDLRQSNNRSLSCEYVNLLQVDIMQLFITESTETWGD